jgi:hypothetical protein
MKLKRRVRLDCVTVRRKLAQVKAVTRNDKRRTPAIVTVHQARSIANFDRISRLLLTILQFKISTTANMNSDGRKVCFCSYYSRTVLFQKN